MTQRSIAVVIAAPLLLVLALVAAAAPLDYAVYSPGPTFDVLGKDAHEAEIIQIDGHEVYRDDGEIRFTTVRTTPRGERKGLGELMALWLDPDRAVVPYDVAHPPDRTAEDEEVEGEISMTGSQDVAAAVALKELGYDVRPAIQVVYVDEGSPADGKLRVRDIFLRVDGEKVRNGDDVVEAVGRHGPGDPVELLMLRNDRRVPVSVEPREVEGEMRIGVSLGLGYDFPFDLRFNVDPNVGGPSAGLMFALAIYDTLTPGSLTDGEVVAGTGELLSDGRVGPIGGIEQKVAGAEEAGAELFFVPAENCDEVTDLDPDLRLVKATTMHESRLALEAWADDRDAELPTC